MGIQTRTVFPSAARTTHTSSDSINARDAQAVTFEVNVTAFTGTSITFTIQDYNYATATWQTVLASAAISATGKTRYTIGVTTPTTANVSLNAVPPPRMRVTPSGTITSVTYDVTAQLLHA